MQVTLQRNGDDLVIALPEVFVQRHGLTEGSQVSLQIRSNQLIITGTNVPHYTLNELMAETHAQGGLPRSVGWDNMPSIGLERE